MDQKDQELYSEYLKSVLNTYYTLSESADLMLYEADKVFKMMGSGLRYSIKRRHKMMRDTVEKMKNLQEDFLNDYNEQFLGRWNIYDELLKDANTMSRIYLLISDRTNEFSDKELLDKIESMIRDLKHESKHPCTDVLIDRMHMK